MKKSVLYLLILGLAVSIQSCKKDTNKYDIPTTYNFSNVDYSGQTYRLAMITALVNEVKKGNTAGTTLNAQLLKNMYANSGSPFANDTLNTCGKQLKDKTFATDQSVLEAIFDEAATTSAANANATNGTAGIITNGTKSYLVDASGIEYKEAVEKTLQGALIYYQITAVYLSEDKIGKQVALADRQHHWDEAFGYFGVPIDYPTNTTGLQHVGKYANDRNALLGNATAVMNAFLKGRAAINNDDNNTVTEQVAIIRENVEKGVAATAVHYINGALANVSDAPTFHHNMSEGYFLVKSLKYNPAKKITDTQIQTLLNYFGTNFYTVSTTDLQAAKNLLSSIYGFDAVKDQL
ncbi:MAG: DUF4856 domain-containing protein [Chitinophagales bacterium]|nr:DUF4856 domain-containing protein [Chitinophagales bacterium]